MTNTYTHPTDNWRTFPDVRDVTLRPQMPVGADVNGIKGKPRPASGRELSWAASVGLPTESKSWILWVSTLGGTSPRVGDELVDGDTVWIVQTAVLLTLGTRWRLFCTKKGA